jgi:hypothetical protein
MSTEFASWIFLCGRTVYEHSAYPLHFRYESLAGCGIADRNGVAHRARRFRARFELQMCASVLHLNLNDVALVHILEFLEALGPNDRSGVDRYARTFSGYLIGGCG